MENYAFSAAKKIKMFVFDVDGVLTDGGIYIGEKGELFKPFNVRDGFAIVEWGKLGFLSAIITGRESEMVRLRAKKLNITAVWQGDRNKRYAYAELKEKFNLSDEEIAYVGDDFPDLPIIKKVGLAFAVGDAAEEVKENAHVVTARKGGHGAVREAIEFVLKAQNRWQDILDSYLK